MARKKQPASRTINQAVGRRGTAVPARALSRAELELEEFEKVFKALAHPTRRHILVVLRARGNRMTAGAITSRFSCKWPTVTRHLRQLEEAGLVSSAKEGREVIYRLNSKMLQKIVTGWLGWFE